MAAPTINTPFQPYVYQSPQAVVTPFQILGGEAQIVQFLLNPGERVHSEPGAMCYMSANMETETELGRGSFWRWLSGESMFTNTYINNSSQQAYIGFAAPTLAKILPIDLASYGGEIVCQRDAYLCSINDVTVTAAITRRVRVGTVISDALCLQRLAGRGLAFVTAGGSIVQKNLGAGDVVVVDAGCVLAVTKGVSLDFRYVGSIKRALFGGEGLFYAHLTGPGVVFLQSLPFPRLAMRIERVNHLPKRREASILALLFIFVTAFVSALFVLFLQG